MQVELPEGLSTGNGYYSYGFRGDFMLRGFDAGLQWYHGPDLMPGLNMVSADYTNPMEPSIAVRGVPYIINSAGFDFETVISPFVLRGTAAYTNPVEEKEGNEEIPFSQLTGCGSTDTRALGSPPSIQVKVIDFYEAPYDPLIGTELAWKADDIFSTPSLTC
jgi:hypothetical protein